MIHTDNVYCVECSTIVAKDQADLIFKTGFYKVNIPLAHCKKCVQHEKIKLMMGSGDFYEEYSLEFPLSI